MTQFIFVRHGKTLLNIDGCFQGNIDMDLSRLGKAEAKAAAQVLKDVKYDMVYSSPLKRAMQTAEIVNAGHDIEIKTDDAFKELDFGEFDGQKVSYVKDRQHEQFDEWKKDEWNNKVPGGESQNDVVDRVVPFVRELALKYPDKTILLVGHGTCGRCMMAVLMDDEKHAENYILNGSISRFSYDGEKMEILSYGEDEHLKKLFDGYEVK